MDPLMNDSVDLNWYGAERLVMILLKM